MTSSCGKYYWDIKCTVHSKAFGAYLGFMFNSSIWTKKIVGSVIASVCYLKPPSPPPHSEACDSPVYL